MHPFHSTGESDRETLMPRRISSGSWSLTVFPSSILPILVMAPAENNSDSRSVVLPAPL